MSPFWFSTANGASLHWWTAPSGTPNTAFLDLKEILVPFLQFCLCLCTLQLLRLFVAHHEHSCSTLPDFRQQHQLAVFKLCFQQLVSGNPWGFVEYSVSKEAASAVTWKWGLCLLNRSWMRGLVTFYVLMSRCDFFENPIICHMLWNAQKSYFK